jgi:hypothetical protein
VLTRRQWFAAAASGAVALAGWRYTASSEQDGIIAVLYKRLDYLMLDEPGVRAFASDEVAQGAVRGSKLRVIDAAQPVYEHLPQSAAQLLARGEERIVTLYLMSSDFFLNGADISLPVRYLGYFDPIERPRPCGNPFWRPVST